MGIYAFKFFVKIAKEEQPWYQFEWDYVSSDLFFTDDFDFPYYVSDVVDFKDEIGKLEEGVYEVIIIGSSEYEPSIDHETGIDEGGMAYGVEKFFSTKIPPEQYADYGFEWDEEENK